MGRRRCLGCHTIINTGSYCYTCSPRRTLGTSAWKRTAQQIVAAHVAAYGLWCPGYGRDAHPATDLTADHTIARHTRPDLAFDPSNLGAVLCRGCNTRKSNA